MCRARHKTRRLSLIKNIAVYRHIQSILGAKCSQSGKAFLVFFSSTYKYKKRKYIYFVLLVALFGTIIAFRFVAPPVEHSASPLELLMFASLIGIAVAIYAVFRCPKCNRALIPAFSSSWGKLHFCPKCGVELKSKQT